MIKALNLSKNYGDINAVSNLCFHIKEGSVVGLLGPNGAGKTTTIRMLTTFIPPSSGTAEIAGYDLKKEGNEIRKLIGYLQESPPLYPELTVKEYLKFAGAIKGVSKRKINSRIDDLMSLCGLGDVRNRLCFELSKGYKQRVGIAQSLIHNPRIIILDEPTSGLDPVQIIEARKLIKALGEEHTVILSTHLLQEVTETCSSVLIISKGSITHQGSLSELTKDSSLEEAFLKSISNPAIRETKLTIERN